MANISFEASTQFANTNSTSGNNLPQFFTLKNDGDEAVVRFMHDNTQSFEIVTTHQIQTSNGRFRNVNCIRDPREPIDNCPFCKAGMPVRQRFYIHLVSYVKNEQGQIVAQPMVWERNISYAQTLKSYIDNYGPLSDIICKIIRHGKAGDMQTTYEIVPNLNKQIYTDELYPKLVDAFKDYHAVGTTVLNKNFNELDTYVRTGQFPATEQQAAPAQPQYTPAPVQQPIPNPQYTPVQQTTAAPAYGYAPQQEQAPARPVRYYE